MLALVFKPVHDHLTNVVSVRSVVKLSDTRAGTALGSIQKLTQLMATIAPFEAFVFMLPMSHTPVGMYVCTR